MSRKVLIRLLLLAFFITAAISSLDVTPIHADVLDREISDHHADLINKARMEEESMKQTLKKLRTNNLGYNEEKLFECLGGSDPFEMSDKEYLEAFRKGNCSPVIVLGGLMGTKLQVKIDCAVLQKSNPTLFSTCGWTTCSKLNLIGSKPKSEYTIWMPGLMTPFTLSTAQPQRKFCLAGLLGMDWTKTEEKGLVQVEIEGVSIVPMGLTDQTLETSSCGFDSISFLLPVYEPLNPLKYRLFGNLKSELLWRGYRIGINAVAIPYDWRKKFSNNEITFKFKNMVRNMAEISGKRVILVAHSMGNVNMLNNLRKVDALFKHLYIEKYFALAPPYTGTPLIFSSLMGGDDRFSVGDFGVNFWLFKRLGASFPSMYDLMPRLQWTNFKNEYWMKSIIKRINEETGIPVDPIPESEDIVSRIFPAQTEKCYEFTYGNRDKKCLSGLEDISELGKVGQKVITGENLEETLKEHSYFPFAAELYSEEVYARKQYDNYANPMVEVILLYNTINPTTRKFIYNKSPKEKAAEESANFVLADQVVNGLGDGTVLSTSSLFPAIKWAYEFEKKSDGAKPVTFVEICANYKNKAIIRGENEEPKNQYMGVNCGCTSGFEANCDHMGLVSDFEVVTFMVDNMKGKPNSVAAQSFVDNFSDEELNQFGANCKIFNYN